MRLNKTSREALVATKASAGKKTVSVKKIQRKPGVSRKSAKKPVVRPVKKTLTAKKPPRILIINYEFPPLGGGGGVATMDLAREWARHGKVDVLTSTFKKLSRYEKVENINVYRAKVLFRSSRDTASFLSMLSYLFFGFFKGISLIRKNRYTVINTHFAVPSGPLGYILGKIFSIPNLLSLHGGDIYDPSKKSSPHKSFIFRCVVRFILNRADRIVAQSSNTRDNAIKYYKPKKEIGIIPLPFHPVRVKKFKREQFGFNRNDFIIATCGRVVKRKAYDVLIHALFEVKDQRVKLIILGDGPERAKLQDIVNYLGLHDRVRFMGYVSETEKFMFLEAADIFALTSLHEGFGIVFMEAMFYGKPIVCTNHGGQTDFLIHGENALLLNVGDYKSCAEHIRRFMSDKKLFNRCAANNRKKIKMFYADRIATQYVKQFQELSNGS
jgi:glycosyltransferase involved in cell wall biosynthesis